MSIQVQTDFTVADAIVRGLVQSGVEFAFGIVSIHNMPIYDAIKREGSIHLVCSRGESGAVNMADGYARATGKLGVVITSTGTGAGNAAGSLVEAWNAGAPLLHITGEVASSYLGTGRGYIHECKDQLAMMQGCCKKAIHLSKPEQAAAVVLNAINEALSAPSGPVTLQIPIDYQTAIVPDTNTVWFQPHTESNIGEFNLFLPESLISRIVNAERPVIWAGGGVISSGASEEIRKLADTIGAAVITSQSGKGSIPENHPLCIGHFASFEKTKQLLQSSDFLISVGIRFRGNETSNWKVSVPEAHLCIDADPSAMNRNYNTLYGLIGDAKGILQLLLQALSKYEINPKTSFREEVERIKKELRKQVRETLGPYEQILDSMKDVLPKDTILVRDVTIQANVWGSRLFETYEPRTSIHASGGGIGQGLPTAIGAQLGRKDRLVLLMAGDGGFMVNIGELATAAQEHLPIVIVLFDDGGYGVLRNIQAAAYGRQVAVDLLSPDFVMLGKSMGFEAVKVGTPQTFASELGKTVRIRKPTLIVVDMKEIGPMAKPFNGPPGAAEAFKPRKL